MPAEESKYFNRELSWLEFNQRVLDEARDPGVPLLERLKFLAISASNLDEFFMVRVGGLQILAAQGAARPDPSGMTPTEQLRAIGKRTRRMTRDQYACFHDELLPALSIEKFRWLKPGEPAERQWRVLQQVFDSEIFTVLTPMILEPDADFPLLGNGSLSVCVNLAADEDAQSRFAVIPLGRTISRFITLPSDGGYEFVLLEDVVRLFIERFFPGEAAVECVPFRITRNADMSIREDQASDLLAEMQELLDARKESACVRLELDECASDGLREFLQQTLHLADDDVHLVPGPLDLAAFMQLTDLPAMDRLKYSPWPPRPSPAINPAVGMFEQIAQRDVLLNHPYESFEPVLRLVEEAADDPDVLAIKQTLYRTSRNSPLVEALRRAAVNGKYVTAIVELKARFDEARNIEWARNLEQAGVQVIYGVKGFKTHAKICIIVRREPHGIQRYVHFGTGNYNEITARLYSDISYLTCDEALGADATSFFNAVTGSSQPQKFQKLEAAPLGLREKLLEMIHIEATQKQQGRKAGIMAKLNSLVDPEIIDALYAASRAGVPVRLNLRGICCLRPGVPGLSENIRVVSIVDRFLEHSRILYFHHAGDERLFISSADWMPRNLDRRVELLVPVEDDECRMRLVSILNAYFLDNVKARVLLPDGSYARIERSAAEPLARSQEILYQNATQAVQQAEQSRPTVFEPHRAPESRR